MTDAASPRTRPALDREQVARAALRLLDEVGLDDLTMRRLAERLGVTAASLYWHVRDKNELLAMLGDAISAEIPLPSEDLPWREALTQAARGYRRALLAHRDGARVLVATPPVGAQRLRGVEAVLALYRRAGFPLQDVADIGYLANTYITGFVLDETWSAPELPSARPGESTGVTPLGAESSGHLFLREGAENLTVRSDAALAGLYRVVSDGRPPEIEARDGAISFKQRHRRRESCTLTLNGTIPWAIEVQGGVSRFSVEFTGGRLASLIIPGGVSESRLRLPTPVREVLLRIGGGVSNLLVERPAGAALRVMLHRGGSKLTFDGMHLGSAGGNTHWETSSFAAAPDRYDLYVHGGASEITIAAVAGATDNDGGQDRHEPAGTFQRVFGAQPEEYPTLAAVAEYLINPDSDRRFDLGIQIFLDGIERRLAQSRESR